MSNKTKKIGMWSLKALAVGLFVFLAIVNVQVVTGNIASEAGLVDVNVSTSAQSAIAETPCSGECKFSIFYICHVCDVQHRFYRLTSS